MCPHVGRSCLNLCGGDESARRQLACWIRFSAQPLLSPRYRTEQNPVEFGVLMTVVLDGNIRFIERYLGTESRSWDGMER
jgi:hypothetical protein